MNRLQATHYIEQWGSAYRIVTGNVIEIKYMPFLLSLTPKAGYKTIAVFKIKYKQP